MKVFICHSSENKDVVEPISSWLKKKGLQIWFDKWSMIPGDSLIAKIGDNIESSDKLVVCLSPAAVESEWVKREVSNGLIMEIAEKKGLGKSFIVPALLERCKVPFFLKDKLYANFTDKAFEAACEELYRGIIEQPLGSQETNLQNVIVRQHYISPIGSDKYALLIEFAVRISQTDGANIGVDTGGKYSAMKQWFAPPNSPAIRSGGLIFTISSEERKPPIYTHKFKTPRITSTESYYLYFEGNEPLEIKHYEFLDFYNKAP